MYVRLVNAIPAQCTLVLILFIFIGTEKRAILVLLILILAMKQCFIECNINENIYMRNIKEINIKNLTYYFLMI